MKSKGNIKKKIIVCLALTAGLALLIGSFFLRDIFIRAGITEYDKRDILAVKSKYSAVIDGVTQQSESFEEFEITARHGGLFEKSEIEYDENGSVIFDVVGEHIDVLCHTYCYKIYKKDGAVYFAFNQSGTKCLVYSASAPEKESEEDVCETIDENWYYTEAVSAG